MEQIKIGDIVSVTYTGKLDNQTIFDTTDNREPLSFKVGEYQLIPKFEDAVIGMKVGESKSIFIKSEEAYGNYDETLIFDVEKSLFPEDMDIQLGVPIQLRQSDGSFGIAVIQDIKDNSVTLNANHPLAGQNLTFDITISGINQITEEQLYEQHNCGCGCEDDDCDCEDEEDNCDCCSHQA